MRPLRIVRARRRARARAEEQIGPYGFRAIIRDTEGNRVALHSTT